MHPAVRHALHTILNTYARRDERVGFDNAMTFGYYVRGMSSTKKSAIVKHHTSAGKTVVLAVCRTKYRVKSVSHTVPWSTVLFSSREIPSRKIPWYLNPVPCKAVKSQSHPVS